MRSTALAVLGVLALTATANTASAQTAGDKADARCVLVLQLAARDPKNKEAAAQGTFYYMGRLMAHGLSGKLEPLMRGEFKALATAGALQGDLTRCGAELNASNNEFRQTFAKMQPPTAGSAAKPK